MKNTDACDRCKFKMGRKKQQIIFFSVHKLDFLCNRLPDACGSTLHHRLKDDRSVGKTCLSPSRSPAHRSATQGVVSFMGPPPHAALVAPFYISASSSLHSLDRLCVFGAVVEGGEQRASPIGDQGTGLSHSVVAS